MIIKNTASQKVGAGMVTAADGSAFTGSITVEVTLDGGTQATGTVGSGACTHEGNGYHTYAPSQAETNGDLCAFTFHGTGAIPITKDYYTRAGDAFTRLGAPAGASVSADVAAIQADTDNLQTRIPAALVSGRIDASVGAMATDVLTAAALNADAVTEIQSGLATAAALATVDDFVDTEIATLVTNVATILAAVDTEVAAILADTNELQVDWVNGGRLDLLIDSIIGYVDALETRLTQALADKLAAHAAGVLVFVLTTGSTTTTVNLSTVDGATPSAVDNFYNGAVMIFTSGALAGQRTSISDYDGTTKIATVVALTGSPANAVTGVIV
jgi:hypothetical protein